MITLNKLAKHTGLPAERVKTLIDENGLDLTRLTMDQGRLEIIGILRAGASGTLKREDTEKEHARLLQAKRIKTEEVIKKMNRGLGKGKIHFEGFLIEDDIPKELDRAIEMQDKVIRELMGYNEIDSDDEQPEDDHGINDNLCSIENCPRINLSDIDYIKYKTGELSIEQIKGLV